MANDDGADADDDATLVRATLDGRVQAFGLLYDRHAPLVRAICYDATRDLAQAQDLAQETFLRAFRELPRLKSAAHFASWLLGIAKHVSREWRRGAGRRRRHLQRVSELAETRSRHTADDDPDADVGESREDFRGVRDAIAALPRREREALHLFYLSEHPADAAAEVLGLSRSGFYRALDRAKTRVRQILGLQRARDEVTP